MGEPKKSHTVVSSRMKFANAVVRVRSLVVLSKGHMGS